MPGATLTINTYKCDRRPHTATFIGTVSVHEKTNEDKLLDPDRLQYLESRHINLLVVRGKGMILTRLSTYFICLLKSSL